MTESKIQVVVMAFCGVAAAGLAWFTIRQAPGTEWTMLAALALAIVGNLIVCWMSWRASHGQRPVAQGRASTILTVITWVGLALMFAPRLIAAVAR